MPALLTSTQVFRAFHIHKLFTARPSACACGPGAPNYPPSGLSQQLRPLVTRGGKELVELRYRHLKRRCIGEAGEHRDVQVGMIPALEVLVAATLRTITPHIGHARETREQQVLPRNKVGDHTGGWTDLDERKINELAGKQGRGHASTAVLGEAGSSGD
jgi:hypothetical protein